MPMPEKRPKTDESAILEEVLGYLNFSSGTPDPQFLRGLNRLFAIVESSAATDDHQQPSYVAVGKRLEQHLDVLSSTTPAFADVDQAREVLRLAFHELPPRYRQFHRDLLFHQSDAAIWRPFFVGRVVEAILLQGPPWSETDRIADGAITHLNDYVGHRPVATLSTSQRLEPYPHERIRPVPIYIRDAGIGVGRYEAVLGHALEIVRATDPALLREAHFDPELLDELALDPRAYDFDHPVNKRPNYHFGQWDPHHLDNQGRYRRFVVQQVTIDVLLERVSQQGELPPEELLVEAAAVLAGTVLMASGTSGSGVDAHDSMTTLGTLLPRIAAYRDAFYEQFIAGVAGPHGDRLRAEAVADRQPLARARQHLNQALARQRALQLEQIHLALLYARMGYPEAALRQAQVLPVTSARMTSEIQCRVTTGHRAVDCKDLARAAALIAESEDFLHRAIQCGALADPWCILGFQGQFSLFPSPENSVIDHRLDQLIALLEQIVALYARIWSEAAADEQATLAAELSASMKRLTDWWDQFAPTSVEDIEAFFGGEAFDSAREVAQAMAAFRHAGAAAGDIAFWRKHAAEFNSPKAYALVVNALLEMPDVVATMALLMQWLSQAGLVALTQGEYSFHTLAERWLDKVCFDDTAQSAETGAANDCATLLPRFFELLEANAEDYWQVPSLDLLGVGSNDGATVDVGDVEPATDDNEDEEDSIYRAAYDEMVYVDSTDDGIDADMLESGGSPSTDFELDAEARRVGERLQFLRTVANLWQSAVLGFGPRFDEQRLPEVVSSWLTDAAHNQRGLAKLLASVDARSIPAPTANRESMLEFDRRRTLKEALVEKIVATSVETADATRLMRGALTADQADETGAPVDDQTALDAVVRSVLQGDPDSVRRLWPDLIEHLHGRPILYVPLAKGGQPARLVEVRTLQQALRDLAVWLPRLGLYGETCQLVELARLMESECSVGPGAISEYDRLFAQAYESLVESLVDVSAQWPDSGEPDPEDHRLIECLELVTESLLRQWLPHSRTLRLSVLERIGSEKSWNALVAFVQRYGRDLFTQRFLHLGNLRAILHQGVDNWLAQLEEHPPEGGSLLLLDELGTKLPRGEAVKQLSLVLEAVAENYAEYRDYNSTTTQSDRGDLLYTLLDFLRLRVQYDRIAWHMKPVLAAHSILVRRGRNAAAELWRRALSERTSELADKLQTRYNELRQKYAMRVPTIADRVGERFVRPLAIDRICALIGPALAAASTAGAGAGREAIDLTAFELLEQEAADFAQGPTGVGLDVPNWIVALEQEVEREQRARNYLSALEVRRRRLPQVPLSFQEVQQRLTGWELNPRS